MRKIRRRGRPPLPGVARRGRMINVRVTEESAAKFERFAASRGYTLSGWIRTLMFAAAGK